MKSNIKESAIEYLEDETFSMRAVRYLSLAGGASAAARGGLHGAAIGVAGSEAAAKLIDEKTSVEKLLEAPGHLREAPTEFIEGYRESYETSTFSDADPVYRSEYSPSDD